jgi:CII-binding regulator of phage lambda lysogenization HflD
MSENAVDRLEIQVQTQAQKANAELDKMANRLRSVASALQSINDSGKVQGIANGVTKLGQAMQTMSNVKTADFTRLAKNIEKLGNVNQAGINSTASALRTISSALTASVGLNSGAQQITDLANSISKLGNKSAATAITNIPLMANALKSLMQTLSTSPNVSQNLINMTNAIANLSAQGSKVRSATNSIDSSVKRLNSSVTQATSNTRNLSLSLAGLYAKFWMVRRAVNMLWGSVEKSMDYSETINLFQTSFKKLVLILLLISGWKWVLLLLRPLQKAS